MENAGNADEVKATESWKTKALIIGAIIGAVVGLGGAYLLVQNAEKKGHTVSVSAGDGVKLGLLVMGLLRQVAELGSGK
jgi:ABC-type Mn2+/Zn2+ transport system permease subunit